MNLKIDSISGNNFTYTLNIKTNSESFQNLIQTNKEKFSKVSSHIMVNSGNYGYNSNINGRGQIKDNSIEWYDFWDKAQSNIFKISTFSANIDYINLKIYGKRTMELKKGGKKEEYRFSLNIEIDKIC